MSNWKPGNIFRTRAAQGPNSTVVIFLQAHLETDGTRNYCSYDSDIATGLGVGSFLFLMISQILITVASRCLCCGKALRPSGSRSWAIFLFITCWYVLTNIFILKDLLLLSYMISFRFTKTMLA